MANDAMTNDAMTREWPMTNARLNRETQPLIPTNLSLCRPLPIGALVIPWSLVIASLAIPRSSVIPESQP